MIRAGLIGIINLRVAGAAAAHRLFKNGFECGNGRWRNRIHIDPQIVGGNFHERDFAQCRLNLHDLRALISGLLRFISDSGRFQIGFPSVLDGLDRCLHRGDIVRDRDASRPREIVSDRHAYVVAIELNSAIERVEAAQKLGLLREVKFHRVRGAANGGETK